MAEKEKKAGREARELMKAEPARLLSPFEQLERQFEELFRRPFSLLSQPTWRPARRGFVADEFAPSVDIYEEDGSVVMKAELPGMKKDDISVDITDSTITISGEKKGEEKVEDKNFYRHERFYGSFVRSFDIPTDIKADEVKAKFHNGILEVRLPKTEEAKQKAKKVAIE
jgi:HSP20 family protein